MKKVLVLLVLLVSSIFLTHAYREEGMDYCVLLSGQDCSFASQVTKPNTIYEIRDVFDLDAKAVTIPAGCVLKFEGGSLRNGELIGQRTVIDASLVEIFDTIFLSGTYVNAEWNVEWFGASDSVLNNDLIINYAIDQLYNIGGGTLVFNNDLTISSTIYLRNGVSIVGCRTSRPQNTTAFQAGGTYIKCAFSNKQSWIVSPRVDNAATYNSFDIASATDVKLTGIRIENLYFRHVNADGSEIATKDLASTTGIFGGIRLCRFDGATLKNVTVWGTKYGLSLDHSWCATIEKCFFCSTICGAVLSTAVTMQQFNNCRFRKMIYFQGDKPCFDASLFRDSASVIPTYLNSSDVKSVGMIGNNGVGHYGPNVCLESCTFELWDISLIAVEGVWTINHFYNEAIQKTFVWAVSSHLVITNEAYNISKGVPILAGGYEFGGRDNSDFYLIGRFGMARCYPDATCNYTIECTGISGISFYDTYSYDADSGSWSFSKNPRKKIVLSGEPQTIYLGSTSADPTIDNPRTPRVSLGTEESYRTVYPELASRVNNLIVGQDVNVYFRDNVYSTWATDAIRNKKMIVYTNAGSSPIKWSPGFIIDDCEIMLDEDQVIDSTGPFFIASGECVINIYGPVENVKNKRVICTLSGDKSADVSIIIRNAAWSNIMDHAIYVSNLDTFPYPVKISVYNGATLWKTFTNATRPTKGVPVGYVYIEKGVPIFYTGEGWINADGTPAK